MGRDATTVLPCEPTGDIARFAAAIVSAASALKERDRDVYPASVRILWTGRIDRDAGPGGTRRGRKRHHDDTAAVKADEWDAASIMRLQSDEETSGGVLRGMKSFDMFSRNRSRKGLDQINMGPSSSSHKLDTQLLPALLINGYAVLVQPSLYSPLTSCIGMRTLAAEKCHQVSLFVHNGAISNQG